METAELMPELKMMDKHERPVDPFRSAIHPRISQNLGRRRTIVPYAPGHAIDPQEFRKTLGHVPTSVVVVTGMGADGPLGVAIGSFVSISLDPPLVGFFSDRKSVTVPMIVGTGAFCVNVLGANRAELGRVFSRPSEDRFSGLEWQPGVTGCPALSDSIAWIECDVMEEIPLGDHNLIVGAVKRLAVNDHIADPVGLAFYRGGFSGLNSDE